ncbi:hypothetical protein NPX13_g2148 [Xylaria arbuscula]|uniref:Uncharacterized protein n=1 Tax=Xylaria arbuscula TaxID=114810 RepID=A0A9W8NL34_9PEZI|nr:hypothetical protein NPX13_g2148 [Xylaria arbuscula]
MRFTLAIFASLFAAAVAVPPTSDTFGALEKKCLASGATSMAALAAVVVWPATKDKMQQLSVSCAGLL